MLIDLILISTCFIIVSCFVALEVALVNARTPALADWTKVESKAGHACSVRVDDYVVLARICEPALFIAIALAAMRLWNSSVGELLSPWLPSDRLGSLIRGVLVIPLVVLVLGVSYQVPARIGERFPEGTIERLSRVARYLTRLALPVVSVIQAIGKAVVPAPNAAELIEEEEIEEDIRSLVEEGEKAGVIQEEEKKIITSVFKLSDRPVPSLMTPRADVVFLSAAATPETALPQAIESRLTWFPVTGDSEDEIVGIVCIHDLLRPTVSDSARAVTLRELAQPVVEIPESMTALELLERFREEDSHFAVIRDEYGSVACVVTVDDVLSLIVGEIGDSNGEDRSIVTCDDGSMLVDAASDVQNLFDTLGVEVQEEVDRGQFHSVGGFIMTSLGHIPKEGDSFVYNEHRFEVVDMDGKRIDKVLVRRVSAKEAVGQI